MKRFLLPSAVLSLVSLAPLRADADQGPTWVFFHDKDVAAGHQVALSERASLLSPRALSRRQRVRGDAGVDERDLDVSARFVDSIRATGAHVRATSRWLNAVSVTADAAQLQAIASLPQVKSLLPVARHARPGPAPMKPAVPLTLPG